MTCLCVARAVERFLMAMRELNILIAEAGGPDRWRPARAPFQEIRGNLPQPS